MKILLVGEYSGLHNTLKEALIELGHEVTLMGTQDGFKKFPVDLDYGPVISSHKIASPLVSLLYKVTRVNLTSIERALRFYVLLPKAKNHDIVQLINENSIKTAPALEKILLKRLFKNNHSIFLLSCGTDYISLKYAFDKKFRYSILTPFFKNPDLSSYYRFILAKLKPNNYRLHSFIFENIKGVIASDMDYHIPLIGHKKYLGLIPNPINLKSIRYTSMEVGDKIIIFHGINKSNYIKKGNDLFEEALKTIKNKFPERVEVISTYDLPYTDYLKSYNKCHILLDQVYAYDQGYNALFAMARGKVVFTGAEKEWLETYHLKEDAVAINALPDPKKIAEKLEWLITNPKKIEEISKNARKFIEKEHDYLNIGKKYLEVWSKSI